MGCENNKFYDTVYDKAQIGNQYTIPRLRRIFQVVPIRCLWTNPNS